MRSRHTREEPLWGLAPAGPAAVPESTDLPPRLRHALDALAAEAAGTASFTLFPMPESVTAARRFAVRLLDDWGIGSLSDEVALVVTELVTNALRHSIPALADLPPAGRPVSPCRNAPPAPASIRLRMAQEEPWLLCGIFDAGAEPPRRRAPDFIAETGRGLHLVESFTDRWGWRGLPAGGKVVWATFELPRSG